MRFRARVRWSGRNLGGRPKGCNKRAKELAALNRERARLEKAYTHACLSTTDASQTHRAALGAQIQDLNERIGEHRAVTKSLPHKVPVGETLDPDTVVRLEPERKIFTDLVRTLAYRAESALLGRVGPLLARDGEEGPPSSRPCSLPPRTSSQTTPNSSCASTRWPSLASTGPCGPCARPRPMSVTSTPEPPCAWSSKDPVVSSRISRGQELCNGSDGGCVPSCGGSGNADEPALRRYAASGSARDWRRVPPAAPMAHGGSATAPRSPTRCPMPSSSGLASHLLRTMPQLKSVEPPCTDPYARWCGRGGAVRLPPIPIRSSPRVHRMDHSLPTGYERWKRPRCRPATAGSRDGITTWASAAYFVYRPFPGTSTLTEVSSVKRVRPVASTNTAFGVAGL